MPEFGGKEGHNVTRYSLLKDQDEDYTVAIYGTKASQYLPVQ
jgi:hypothetical protein